jgi:hypothetical protein
MTRATNAEILAAALAEAAEQLGIAQRLCQKTGQHAKAVDLQTIISHVKELQK